MTAFDVQTVPLQGLNLIEASAGTGKTYTLAELYVRLIVEKALPVNQILVVTYTRAATEELRDRLRQKLVQMRDELTKAVQQDSIRDGMEADALARDSARVLAAIQHFDEAAIYTIHGFCQRVLSDFAFECGYPFDWTLAGDDLTLAQSVADDFWRRYVTTLDDRFFTAYLLHKKQSPETLLSAINNRVGQSYLHCIPVADTAREDIVSQLEQQFAKLKHCWQQEQDSVRKTLLAGNLLKKNSYNPDKVPLWLQQLEHFLSSPCAPTNLCERFDKFTHTAVSKALLKNKTLPALQFWSVCEQLQQCYQQLQDSHEKRLQQLRLQLLNYLREQLPLLKQQQGVQSYDDLLLNLEQALQGPQGDVLVSHLRQRYQAALIDEFQDTDPIQYACFSRIYADSGLATFLVGDPKQAIYSFRGADIFTYLKAKHQAEQEYTLQKNWRSQSSLVQAVNSLFTRQAVPFVYQDIPFTGVEAERQQAELVIEDDMPDAALQISWIDADRLNKNDLVLRSAADTADRIARLLNLAQQQKAWLIDSDTRVRRPLTGGDMAVLVRDHHQAQAVQRQLRQRGIYSVQQSRDSVYGTVQAQVLQRVLAAIAEYHQHQRVTAALATPLWGLDAQALFQLQQDEQGWQQQISLFYQWHQQWRRQGWMPMFRQLLSQSGARQHLLALEDGERWLTNLNHLAELIQQHCLHSAHPQTVLNWLDKHIQLAAASASDEAAQMRLESDAQLVKIITIHKSKGLEYPLVFCPFLWDVKKRMPQGEVISFYDESSGQIQLAFSEPALSQAREKAQQESRAEDIRLLYVALTRARERCFITWGNMKEVEHSALFSLLHPMQEKPDRDDMMADLQALAAQAPASFYVEQVQEGQTIYSGGPQSASKTLRARSFSGQIQPHWRIGSFSALTQGHDSESVNETADDIAGQRQDDMTVYQKQGEADRFSFPRGAQAGSCLHAILETLDLAADSAAMESLVAQKLLQYGFDNKWTATVSHWLHDILHTPLDTQQLTLAGLNADQYLQELAFYFPVNRLAVSGLQYCCQPYLAQNPLLKATLQRLRFTELAGFMKGFIDLVFEYKGRFYIVDYKSNYLGNTMDDYHDASLDAAMIAHDYPLQYLIYAVALHRYLRLRLPDYDPACHLGGVYYLFLRGMKPQWGQAGIFFDRLDIDLIQALDQYLQGDRHD